MYSKKSRMAQAEEGLPPYRLVRMPGGRRKPERRQQMDKQKIAKSTMELADMLCISLEEAWEKHTDLEVKRQCSLEEIKVLLETS